MHDQIETNYDFEVLYGRYWFNYTLPDIRFSSFFAIAVRLSYLVVRQIVVARDKT